MIFDENAPPAMPVSALLFDYQWMRLVHYHAPWLVYLTLRDARRDAEQCALWLRFYACKQAECYWWHATNINPIRVTITPSYVNLAASGSRDPPGTAGPPRPRARCAK